MKLRTILSLLFVALVSTVSFGQGTIHIVYDVTVSSDNPQMQSMQSMFDGSSMEMFSNDQYYRVNMKLGALTTTNIIYDVKSKSGITLISSSMAKMAMKMNPEDIEKAKESKGDISVKLIDSTKEIAGYQCKKAIITINGMAMEMWYAPKLKIAEVTGSPLDYEKVPGAPLEFSVHKGPMDMSYRATKIETNVKVNPSIFDQTIPAGYTLMTADDIKKMGGQ